MSGRPPGAAPAPPGEPHAAAAGPAPRARRPAPAPGGKPHAPARRGGRPRLLVLRALGLGDLLCAVPALRALAEAFPQRRRLLAAPAGLAPLVALIGPDPRRPPGRGERAIDELVPLPPWVGGQAPPTAAAARLPHGALAVNLHGSGPESHRLLLATAPERLLAFAHPDVPASAEGPPWERPAAAPGPAAAAAPPAGDPAAAAAATGAAAPEHETARWCRLLAAYGIAADPGRLELPVRPAHLLAGLDATIVHPGAASEARRWPAERWAAVARAERRRGRVVVVTGSPSERPLAERVAAAAGLPESAVLAGRSDLAALAGLVAAAGRVVCGDTGVAHLATATRTPSVVLFGPVAPARWGPPPERPWHRALHGGGAGGGDPHADRPDPALLAIEPAAVVRALAELPPRPPAQPPPALREQPAPRPPARHAPGHRPQQSPAHDPLAVAERAER